MACGESSSSSSDYEMFSHSSRPGIRIYFGYNVWEWILLLCSMFVISTTAVTTISQLNLVLAAKGSSIGSLIVNIIVILNLVPCSLSFVYGLFWEKHYDLLFFPVHLFVIGFYITLEFAFTSDFGSTEKLVRLCVVVACLPIIAILAKLCTNHVTQFRIVGASSTLITMYKTLCQFSALLRLEVLLLITFGLLNVPQEYNKNIPKFSVLIIIIICAFLQWMIGKIAVTKEMISLLIVYVVISTAVLLWIPVQIIVNLKLHSEAYEQDELLSVSNIFGAIALVVSKVVTYIQLMKVYRHFGYGLTDRAFIMLVASESTSLLSGSRSRTAS